VARGVVMTWHLFVAVKMGDTYSFWFGGEI
jgi:hypothetical protein